MWTIFLYMFPIILAFYITHKTYHMTTTCVMYLTSVKNLAVDIGLGGGDGSGCNDVDVKPNLTLTLTDGTRLTMMHHGDSTGGRVQVGVQVGVEYVFVNLRYFFDPATNELRMGVKFGQACLT